VEAECFSGRFGGSYPGNWVHGRCLLHEVGDAAQGVLVEWHGPIRWITGARVWARVGE